MKIARSEHEEQTILFNWARTYSRKYPVLGLMFAIPNGGKRHIVTAKKMKAEGVKSGVPDIFLPVPSVKKQEILARGGYIIGYEDVHSHGLFIEMKAEKGKPSTNQKEWAKKLEEQGYQVAVCYGFREAAKVINEYLGEEIPY